MQTMTPTSIRTQRHRSARLDRRESGVSLLIIAGSLLVILGAAALSIDLSSLYLERSEAQRAADAGALAGARIFTQGCTLTGTCLSGLTQSAATTQATTVAQQNLIFGQVPTVPPPVFTAGGGQQTDPLITVTVQAPAKTFFLPLSSGAQITATATAEAYNASGSAGPAICASCLKPFFVPNCDPTNLTPLNPNCPTTAGAFFSGGTITNPTNIVGKPWSLHLAGVGGTTAVPSQWLEVSFDAVAPGCSGGQGATAWAQNVTQCATNAIKCGDQLCTLNGGKQGPNIDAVCGLITYGDKCKGNKPAVSVDSVDCSSGNCQVTAGAGNPFSSGGSYPQSSSVVSVPVYDGTPQSGGGPVTVVGYMQIFIKSVSQQNVPGGGQDMVVDAVIMGATTCGNTAGGSCSATGGGSGSTGTVSGGGGTLIPVRLVQNP
jgi:Flp pilus assembly protein TadG